MVEIGEVDGRPFIDYMARDYESLLQAMRARIPQTLSEWRDFTNEADFGNVLLQLFAHMGDILSYYQDRVANESFLATARTRRSVIEHLRLIGYELASAAPSAADLAVSVPATVTDVVTVFSGDAFATSSHPDRPSVRFEYLGAAPLTINFGALQPDPVTRRKVFGAAGCGIPVQEGRSIRDELVGVSNGSPNQRFPLTHPRLILRPPGPGAQSVNDLRVVTNSAGQVSAWTRRDSLAFSQFNQQDYVVEIDAEDRAVVVFGDGVFGSVPPSGAQIRASYRVGGGQAGNVPPETINNVVSSPALATLGAEVFNPGPATGGADRESIAQAVRQAPSVFRSMRRAVTAGDYETLALSFGGVGKVRAAPTGWNHVTLYVAPVGGGSVSDVLEAGLIAFFEDKRMLSQIIQISDVKYVEIRVTALVTVESFYAPADVLARVRQAGAELLAFDRVDFGEKIYLSRFYEHIQNVPGVVSLRITEFRRADPRADPMLPLIEPLGTIELGPHEVPIIPASPEYAAGLKAETDELGRQ
ncbi:baseplate J/gp47 family protein [Streptomyces sp. NPDC006197]|uniref:baseplate J/gp47 family protein n=1 Tax=Streptomyces sp. NPDC006197 TaxID=3156685 RepID=UPI0033AD40AB